MTTNTTDITLQLAQTVVDACMRRAEELDLKMNAAVVDSGANLKAFNRMDGAWLGSIDISIKKPGPLAISTWKPATSAPWCNQGSSCITWNSPTTD